MKKVFKKMSAVIASGLMLFAVACSVDSSDDSSTAPSVNTGSGPSVNPEDNSETEKNGAVSVAASVSKVTVTFRDAEYEGKNDDVVVTLVQGQNSNAKIPEWSRAGYELTGWTSSVEGLTVKTALSKDVTFTAEWTKYYTVTFKDSEVAGLDTNEDVTQKILETAASKTATVPSWAKTGYILSWESSVDGLTVESEITENVTFTSKWTARTAYTVTFKDNDNGNADVTEKVYEGDKPANVPSWTKEHYTLSWNGDTTAAITDNVTFTAIWTENRYYTVKFVDSEISADVTGGEAIAAESDATNDTQKVYDGEKADLPSWASAKRVNKAAYTATWTSSATGLTPSSALTAAEGVTEITFTASWTKTPELTYITFSGSKVATAECSSTAYTVECTANVNSKTTIITYKDVAYQAIKIESSTNITISGSKGKKVTIVTDEASRKIVINGTRVSTGTDKLYVVEAEENSNDKLVITKGDTMNVGVIIIEN